METYEGIESLLYHDISKMRDYLMDSAGQRMAHYGLLLVETRSRSVCWKSFSSLEETKNII